MQQKKLKNNNKNEHKVRNLFHAIKITTIFLNVCTNSIHVVTLHNLWKHDGNVTVAQKNEQLPFAPRNVSLLFSLPSGSAMSFHWGGAAVTYSVLGSGSGAKEIWGWMRLRQFADIV